MNTTTTVIVVAAIVVLAVAVLVGRPMMRRRRLRTTFGPEYDRVVQRHDNRSAAERELLERQRRHAELDIRPLSPSARARYTQDWSGLQERFVDEPAAAVRDAERLVTAVLAERGYPTDDDDEKVALLSIDHSRTLDRYRAAHATRRRLDHGPASRDADADAGTDAGTMAGRDGMPAADGAEGGAVATEELRQALVQYRELFVELVGTADHDGRPATDTDHRADPDTAGTTDRTADVTAGDVVDRQTDSARHAAR